MDENKFILPHDYKSILLQAGLIAPRDVHNEDRCLRRWAIHETVKQKTAREVIDQRKLERVPAETA